MSKSNIVKFPVSTPKERAIEEMSHLLALFQIASDKDKRIIWAILEKYEDKLWLK